MAGSPAETAIMNRKYLALLAILLMFALSAAAPRAVPAPAAWQDPGPGTERPPDEFAVSVRPFVEKYCLECHAGSGAEGGIDLDAFAGTADVRQDLETWEAVIDALDSDYMPPDSMPQPTDQEVTALRAWLTSQANDSQAGASVPITIRRMNRIEYENTVRDLLRLKVDVFDNPDRITITDDYFRPSSGKMPRYVLAMSHYSYIQRKPAELPDISELPNDPPVEHGFNNDQSTLSFSPVYLEACLKLARSILDDENFPRQSLLWESLFVADDHQPGEALVADARQRLASFLPRAFRRPVTETEIDRYTGLLASQLPTQGFTESMKSTVAAILASPSFLFRSDRLPPAEGEPPDPWAMASRLSYFLWGSMPDDSLFQAAAENRLRTDAQLLLQVRRMLDDSKSKSLSTDFGMQWLKVDKVNSARPDPDLYPGWYRKDADSPGVSMMIEQMLLFETIMVEDRSILEFINADYAYLNRQLMDWYYVDPETALGYTPPPDSFEDFFRIRWPDRHRGGVITSGAMLVSTSATTRTSPVYRGTWVLDVIFNRPPPPPPPDVPALEGDGNHARAFTNVRDKLAAHRENPSCAVCHDRIDPVGFALEKLDPVARFRRQYPDGTPIDTAGEIFDDPFDGAARFKNVVLRQKDRFVQGFVEHVLRYALGRELGIGDDPQVRQMAGAVADQDYRFRAVIESIVLSDVFRSRSHPPDKN